jgi:hypothetical protein
MAGRKPVPEGAARVGAQYTAPERKLKAFKAAIARMGDNQNLVIEEFALDKYTAAASGMKGLQAYLGLCEFRAELWRNEAVETRAEIERMQQREAATAKRHKIQGYDADIATYSHDKKLCLPDVARRLSVQYSVNYEAVLQDLERARA